MQNIVRRLSSCRVEKYPSRWKPLACATTTRLRLNQRRLLRSWRWMRSTAAERCVSKKREQVSLSQRTGWKSSTCIASNTMAKLRPSTKLGSAISSSPKTSSGIVNSRPRMDRGVKSPYLQNRHHHRSESKKIACDRTLNSPDRRDGY